MTFQQALAAIQRDYPAASVGLTARRGKDYYRGQSLDFQPCGKGQFRAVGPKGGVLYLGVGTNPKRSGYLVISCGPNE